MSVSSGSRRVVTVLFADLVGSTSLGEQLDPEPLRVVMSRYYEIAQVIVSGHGGTVEKFVGDAVMAVFGMPVAHEDDPLRAARAAVELRDAVRALGEELRQMWPVEIELRLGITTGEVMAASTDAANSLVTGDAVN